MLISAALYFQYVALSLLIVGGLVTAAAWVFVVKAADGAARSWFAAVTLQLVSGMVLFAVETEWREPAYFVAAIIMVSAMYLALYSTALMLQRARKRRLLGWWIAHLLGFGLLHGVMGWQELAFVASMIATTTVQVLIIAALRQIRTRMDLIATLFAEVAFAAAILGGFIRLLGSWLNDRVLLYTDLSVYSVVAMSLQGALIVMSCFFYIGVAIQRVESREMALRLESDQLRTRQQMAEDHARETQKLVEERDRMMILNSRFSAVSTLSLLGAGVVHEIAQPLQAARSAIDVLALHKQLSPDDLARQTTAVSRLIDRASSVVENLRRLIREKSVDLQDVDCAQVLRRVFPIFASEAERRLVAAAIAIDPAVNGTWVRANPVLLERVLFNLAVNALEAFDDPVSAGGPAPGTRKLLIDIRRASSDAGASLVIGFHDTGRGVADAAFDKMFELLTSSKEGGTGLGLYLVKSFVESWNGTVGAGPNQHEACGTSIELALPLLQRHPNLPGS